MQHLYAYQRCQRANYELAFDYVRDAFLPDLNSMEVPDLEQLAQYREQASALLKERLEGRLTVGSLDTEVKSTVEDALRLYETQCRKDQTFLRNQMVARTERLDEYHKLLLLLLVAIAEEAERERRKKMGVSADTPDTLPLTHNRLVNAIRENADIRTSVEQQKLSWEANRDEVRQLYKNQVKNDTQYWAYQHIDAPTEEEDIEIVRHIFGKLVMKSEPIMAIFEEKDINWEENRKIVKSLVSRTLKSFDGERITLATLTPNWEDDKEYFEKLYDVTLRNEEEYEAILSEKSKNWAVERIASLDNIIMKMAIAEMIHFSSIPVKVTINEYVDISKQYSTEKSKQFINGMLDAISKDLLERQMIRKSGRGLLDNQ